MKPSRFDNEEQDCPTSGLTMSDDNLPQEVVRDIDRYRAKNVGDDGARRVEYEGHRRAWWSLRCLLNVRWLVEHDFGPTEEMPEVAMLRSAP
jgi:hypothetical protein